MSEQRKNFWIFLTAFAMVFAVSKWLYQQQSDQVVVTKRSCKTVKRSCKSSQQKRVEYQHKRHHRRRCNQKRRVQVQHPAIDEFVFVDKEPVATNYQLVKTRMGYPLSLFGTHTEGMVMVRILVDEQGAYQRHQILSQTHAAFAKQVEPQLGKLSFKPAKKDGRSVSYWVNLPFHFSN